MRFQSILLSAVGLVLWGATETSACSCGTRPSPKVSLQHAAAVFSGKVIKIEPSSTLPKFALDVTIEANRIWKGPALSTFVVQTANSGAACGYKFTIGEQYLVYCGWSSTTDWNSPDGLGTNICDRTQPLNTAAADLKELGSGRTVAEHLCVVSRMTTSGGQYVGRSSIPLRLQYKGDLEGWKGHIGFDAETGTVELSGDMFLHVRDRLGKVLAPKSKFRRIENKPVPTSPFTTLIDLTRVYDLDQRRQQVVGRDEEATFVVTWGCRGIAQQTSFILVIPPIGQRTAPSPKGVWLPLVPWKNLSREWIVLNPTLPWRISRGWGRPFTDNVTIDVSGGYPKFIVRDANRLHTWIRYGLAIDVKTHPILVLKYRARNLAKKDWYGLWLDDGTGRRGKGLVVFDLSKLVADGEIHELRADLRTLKPAGKINGMAIGVFCGEKSPAVFELLGVRFGIDQPGTATAADTTGKAP